MAMIDRVQEYADINNWTITSGSGVIKVEKNGEYINRRFEITMDVDELLQQMKMLDGKASDDVQGEFPFAE